MAELALRGFLVPAQVWNYYAVGARREDAAVADDLGVEPGVDVRGHDERGCGLGRDPNFGGLL